MRHEQAAKLAARFLRPLDCTLVFAACFAGGFRKRTDLAFGGEARLLFDEIGFLVRGGLYLIRSALREDQRVMKRLFHRFEMADPLLEIVYFRLQRSCLLRVVLKRFDDFVQKLIDFRAIVALQRFLETLVLNIDRRNLLHA